MKSVETTQMFFLILSMFGLIFGEIMFYYGKINYGFIIQIVSLLGIIFMIILFRVEIRIKNILQSLTLLILLRVTSLSIPRFFEGLYQYQLIYGVMFIPIFAVIKNQQISKKELGIDFRRIYIYFPIALIIGTIAAIIENEILAHIHLIDEINFQNLIYLTLVMVLFVGTAEEIIFRSILFTRFEKIFGLNFSILLSGLIFGIMHSNYGVRDEILFASAFGIFLSYIFYKTKSLPFIVMIHGFANVILYGLLQK